MQEVFDFGRLIAEDSSNPYLHLAYKCKLKHYKLISSGELFVKSKQKNVDVPEFVMSFVSNNNEVLMMANIIAGKVVGLTFRTITGPKDFLTWGNNKGNFYGLGMLDSDFKYGTPIILVEGLMDCDVVKQYYNNTMAVLTSGLTKNQVAVLTRLTNKVILMLDNDDAGKKGTKSSLRAISDVCDVKTFTHYPTLKDAGDIIKLEINKDPSYEMVNNYYKMSINNMIR